MSSLQDCNGLGNSRRLNYENLALKFYHVVYVPYDYIRDGFPMSYNTENTFYQNFECDRFVGDVPLHGK